MQRTRNSLVLELLLVLLMFGTGDNVRVLFGIVADNASGNFVAIYSLAILANDIDSEFLGGMLVKVQRGKTWDVLGRTYNDYRPILVRIIHPRALLG
jgi:hypothetical protein